MWTFGKYPSLWGMISLHCLGLSTCWRFRWLRVQSSWMHEFVILLRNTEHDEKLINSVIARALRNTQVVLFGTSSLRVSHLSASGTELFFTLGYLVDLWTVPGELCHATIDIPIFEERYASDIKNTHRGYWGSHFQLRGFPGIIQNYLVCVLGIIFRWAEWKP